MSPFEQRLLTRLLEKEPTLRELRDTAAERNVCTVDEYGSLWFEVPDEANELPMRKLSAEAAAADTDGIQIEVLLFAVGAFLKELQIYKVDGTPIVRIPDAESFVIEVQSVPLGATP